MGGVYTVLQVMLKGFVPSLTLTSVPLKKLMINHLSGAVLDSIVILLTEESQGRGRCLTDVGFGSKEVSRRREIRG